ncbi:type II toxin-antitoxin system VapC family toxin [Amycolatopsis nigrescens]|uniref:type II toxin-antitoxin system VapC family toxin n=1 Tax=Amycolatopsis nigrescens TaxID=381445 RepID=UPI000379D337|nr:type II toxin-antitoxin system VapC family toxin [Amycolatopsis nigrescens]
MIYFDSSALVKLVLKEAETPDLEQWLVAHAGSRKGSSTLARVELPRAVRQGGDLAYLRSQVILGDLLQLPMTPALLDTAGALPGMLRSLDAIHLASALQVREELESFVCYDRRLRDAAQQAGLPTASPGES